MGASRIGAKPMGAAPINASRMNNRAVILSDSEGSCLIRRMKDSLIKGYADGPICGLILGAWFSL
jgi:hypothetical protein